GIQNAQDVGRSNWQAFARFRRNAKLGSVSWVLSGWPQSSECIGLTFRSYPSALGCGNRKIAPDATIENVDQGDICVLPRWAQVALVRQVTGALGSAHRGAGA